MISSMGRPLVLKQNVHRTPKRGEETPYIRVAILDTVLVLYPYTSKSRVSALSSDYDNKIHIKYFSCLTLLDYFRI